jgi:hypothetical protein
MRGGSPSFIPKYANASSVSFAYRNALRPVDTFGSCRNVRSRVNVVSPGVGIDFAGVQNVAGISDVVVFAAVSTPRRHLTVHPDRRGFIVGEGHEVDTLPAWGGVSK